MINLLFGLMFLVSVRCVANDCYKEERDYEYSHEEDYATSYDESDTDCEYSLEELGIAEDVVVTDFWDNDLAE